MKKLALAAIAVAVIVSSAPAEARRYKNSTHHSYNSSDPRPRAWCGWQMRQWKGVADRRFNLARNWARWGSATTPRPGAVVVWRSHVGELVSHVRGNIWVVRSGNDSRAVRTRPRSIAGAIAFRE